MILYWVLLLLIAFVAYTLGSLNTKLLASQLLFRRNLLRLGKGSRFLFNFKRIFGIKGMIQYALLELAKCLLPLLLGGLLLSIRDHALVGRAFAGFCLVMGNLFPVFNRFRGNMGAVALVMTALCVDFSVGIAAAAVMAAVAWFSRYLSLSVMAGALFSILLSLLVLDDRLAILLMAFSAGLVLLRQFPAISRLLNHTEEKFVLEEDISYKFDEKM